MTADLNDATAKEQEAIANYEALVKAKEIEIEAATKAVEDKLTRIGDLGVELATMKEDLDDTAQALIEDKKFLAELEKSCSTKEEEWDARCKTRTEELLALADTIKILNDDDALELFKILMVSANAKSSSVRVLQRASHSPCLVAQPFSSSARNCLSSASVSLVSSKSSFISESLTPSLPRRASFSSISFVNASI
jgi:hypothetical protein